MLKQFLSRSISFLQTKGVPQILEAGCYQDRSGDRAFNKLYANLRKQIDWWNMRAIVTKCAERAFVRGYRYFGVQFYGECWGDDRPRPTYDKHGPGKGCTDGQYEINFKNMRTSGKKLDIS